MFERYRKLIDDWHAFSECVQTPLPKTVRINTLRTDREAAIDLLRDEGMSVAKSACIDSAIEIHGKENIGQLWLYHAGLIHLQEMVSMLPVSALPLKPHDRVLDMCAAPGNKSAQAAEALANTGTVWANDVSPGRIHALKGVFDHRGVVNAAVMTQNAMTLSANMQFDHVIADVPCTCEGTIRKNPELALAPPTLDEYDRFNRIQCTILHRAIDLVKPGGYVVYSTCTFAPEENECVVSEILSTRDDVHIVPIELPTVALSPGCLEWDNKTLHEGVQHCRRLWPHHNNSGGFFVALLQRMGGDSREESNFTLHTTSPHIQDYVYNSLHNRFGVPEQVLNEHFFYAVGAKKIGVSNREVRFPSGEIVSRGMTVCKTGRTAMKPSTQVAMHFGKHMQKNCVDMHFDQVNAFVRRVSFSVSREQISRVESDGLVACTYKGFVIGMAMLKDGKCQSLFSKAWAASNTK